MGELTNANNSKEWKDVKANIEPSGPKAPKDPTAKGSSFYIMKKKEVVGRVQFIYLNDGRLPGFAGLAGNIKDESMLELLKTAEGFRKLVTAIGVTLEAENQEQTIDFVFQMYGKTDPHKTGTLIRVPIRPDGMEHMILLDSFAWSEDDSIPGQIRFEFDATGGMATTDVKLYLQDGFEAPEPEDEMPVDVDSYAYQDMIKASLLQIGNNHRLKKAFDKARRGEEITIAFIGGSITQGAGATPIHTQCYAYKTYKKLCELLKVDEQRIRFIKAGVGGTPSELGIVRYGRDVLREGDAEPDIVVVEFAVNDEGDETKGECYESLARKILFAPNAPAAVLLFSVFADDWNLQERLSPIGRAYDLPMVSIRDAVVMQFYRSTKERVLSKNQFFYDRYHPNNMGHTVMSDCLIHLFQEADRQPVQEDTDVSRIQPVMGDEFQNISLLDRKNSSAQAEVICGSFDGTDHDLQAVEMDQDFTPIKEFPYNWMHIKGTEPFRMKITCTALIMVYKDSGDIGTGKAQVLVNGSPVLIADPLENGWVHCNPVILFRKQERREHLVEVRMAAGDEDKEFTILGFGYV